MLTTKLILVDGLPGSGKSTTAQFIALQLQKHHLPARWFYEDEQPHPIHFWEANDKADFVRRNLNAWQSFAASAHQSDEITILESSIFQRTAGALLAKYDDIDEAWLQRYYDDIQTAIADLAPKLVHFYQNDVAGFMRRTFAERGVGWTQMIVDFVTQAPLSTQRNWVGVDGAIAFLAAYQQLCEYLLTTLTMPKITIENSSGEWPIYYRHIMDFIGLSLVEEDMGLSHYFEQIAGTYKDRHSDFECTVRFEAGQLSVNQVWWPAEIFTPLIPTAENRLDRAAAIVGEPGRRVKVLEQRTAPGQPAQPYQP